jgi:hypothetical protein
VEPKIPGTDWLGLLALAHGWKVRLDGGTERAQRPESSFRDLLVVAYVAALERLFGDVADTDDSPRGRGLRRAYDEREATLRGRIRGRLDLPRYARELATGRADRAPCRFSAHDLDHEFNRALRWALHLARLLRTRRSDSALDDRIDTLEARFAGVSWERVTTADLPTLRRVPAGLRSYEATGALPLARFLIERVELGDAVGGARTVALSFTMHAIFERAFAQAVADTFGSEHDEIAQQEWAFRIGGTASTGHAFRPDVALRGSGARHALVMDTKWKDAHVGGAPEKAQTDLDVEARLDGGSALLFRAKREDIFQAISYAVMARVQLGVASGAAVAAVLVYPTVRPGSAFDEPRVLRWNGERTDVDGVRVYVVGWNIGPGVADRQRLLAQALDELARDEGESAASGVRVSRVN